jgi:hypothetical protein
MRTPLLLLTACAVALCPAAATAQSGSTGGTIGKQGKSVSGGGERNEPAPRRGREAAPERTPQPSAARKEVSLAGRWNVVETCVSGNFPLVYQIQQGSDGRFSGTARSAEGGGHTERILDGQLQGSSIAFSRTITGDLLGARTPRFSGSVVVADNQAREIVGSFQQVGFTCTFRGTR